MPLAGLDREGVEGFRRDDQVIPFVEPGHLGTGGSRRKLRTDGRKGGAAAGNGSGHGKADLRYAAGQSDGFRGAFAHAPRQFGLQFARAIRGEGGRSAAMSAAAGDKRHQQGQKQVCWVTQTRLCHFVSPLPFSLPNTGFVPARWQPPWPFRSVLACDNVTSSDKVDGRLNRTTVSNVGFFRTVVFDSLSAITPGAVRPGSAAAREGPSCQPRPRISSEMTANQSNGVAITRRETPRALACFRESDRRQPSEA